MTLPYAVEIPFVDPPRAFAAFADDPGVTFFDSADEGGGRGRYAYLCVDPAETVSIDVADIGRSQPFERLQHAIRRGRLKTDPDLPPFQTGVAGVLGYELGSALERLPQPKSGLDFPAMAFGVYDTLAAFDLFSCRAWVVASDLAPGRPSPQRRASALAERLASVPPLPDLDNNAVSSWTWRAPEDDYIAAVARTIDYIRAGDIFQANITARADAVLPNGLDLLTLYRRLRWLSPAPFAAFVTCGDGRTLLSASPERFMQLHPDGRISTRPIKGTRPRGESPQADAALARELSASAKDRAENLMIVDLLRNDISRVALIGSVAVSSLNELETFARVHHLVSEIKGRLRPGNDAVDLIRAAFPGGSVTGAPKIRAMEIIHDLETAARGPYCGSVFWIGMNGAMDSNIVIRSLVVCGDGVSAHAGCGIVADSVPEQEYAEMRTKAEPLLAAVAGPAS